MKGKAVFITIGVIFLVLGGVWVYQSAQKSDVTPWDLISDDVVLVAELTELHSINQKLEESEVLKEVIGSSEYLTGILNGKLFQGNKVFVAVQPISRDDFGYLIYTHVNPATWKNDVKNIGLPFSDSTIKKRLYNGIEINEQTKKERHFAYALIDDVLTISESSFLLESALRLYSERKDNVFRRNNASLFKLPTLKSDEGNLYINISNLDNFLDLFLAPESGKARKGGVKLSGAGLTDIKVNESGVLLNGFLINSDKGLLSLFEKQTPIPIDIDGLISNKTASVTHFGISDANQWFLDQAKLIEENGVSVTDSLIEELSRLSVNVESLRKVVGNQFANCYLGKGDDVVSILNLNIESGKISVFDELASKLADQKRDSLYIENYAGYQIRLIDYRNFLHQLLYPIGVPAEQTFFVQVGENLILAENVELIKVFIDDMDTEDTWGKSVDWNNFLSSSLQESNVSLFVDGKLTSVFLQDQLNAKWKKIFYLNHFLNIDKGSVQLSRLESNFYLNTSLQFSPSYPTEKNLEKITYNFSNKIITRPRIVRNHISKDIEVVMQDSANNLYLLSTDLKTIWKTPVGDRIANEVMQLDFYANGKLQLFLATHNSIQIIDRLGRYVEDYPKELNVSSKIEYAQLVDYDRSKRYRYLITEEKGNLILTDKMGKPLDGWNPRPLNGKMLSAAKHYRILGKDYFIATTLNGSVNLLNRRGEMMKGFPLDLAIRPGGEIALTIGNSLTSSFFSVISKDGIKVQFGVDGQIKKKEVLLKKSASSEFSLVKSLTENSYVFLRVDPAKVGILDSEGKALLEIENPGSTDWELTYVENRLKERFYCLFDRQQNFSYYLDFSGQMLLPQPLESTQLPVLYFDEKQKSLSIYNTDNSNLNLITIKR